MANFSFHIGIDYSGQKTVQTRTSALQLYADIDHSLPTRILPSNPSRPKIKNWCRQELAQWLSSLIQRNETFVLGIDHGFSFPLTFLQNNRISHWKELLEKFTAVWPTHQPGITVDSIRSQLPKDSPWLGQANQLRLTECWTSSAKSVFQFDVQGSVAKSTHAGIPWLRFLKTTHAHQLHFWPFDGWKIPAGRSVIAEVYPSILRNRYPRDDRNIDQQDAYAVARWLKEMDESDTLNRYFDPPLSSEQQQIAALEGWILGIM